MSLELKKEVQSLKEENARLKEELIKYIMIVNNTKVGRTKTGTEDIEQEIIQLRLQGFTIKDIANTVNKSVGSIHSVLKKHGVVKVKGE